MPRKERAARIAVIGSLELLARHQGQQIVDQDGDLRRDRSGRLAAW